METHLTAEAVARFEARQMTPEEILRFREHVDACEDCRAKLKRAGAAVVRAWFNGEPDEQELVLFAAGKLAPDRAAEIQEHVSACPVCSEAVEDLKTFAASRPAPSPALVAMPARERPVPLWWGAVAAILLIGVYTIIRSALPQVVARVHDGRSEVTLTRSGQLSGVATGDDQQRILIADALRTGQLPLRPVAIPGSGVLRGEEDRQAFRVMEPVGVRMLSDRPVFRWTPVSGSSDYQVTVFTEDERIVAQATVDGTSWQPQPASWRGMRLFWQVTANRGGEHMIAPAPPAPRASFEIVSDSVAERLHHIEGHLPKAVAYAREGLKTEALHEMSQLIADNPDSDLVRKLRDSLLVK